MKAANAAIRANLKKGDDAMVQAVVDATGWREGTARRCVTPPQSWMGRGFAAYQLLASWPKSSGWKDGLPLSSGTVNAGWSKPRTTPRLARCGIVENPDAARIQLFFPDKRTRQRATFLKSEGFRWAPSEGAWQRHLNNAGRYAAQCVLSKLQREAA